MARKKRSTKSATNSKALEPVQKIRLQMAVTEFALPAPRRGSIEVHSGFGRSQALGLELHQKIQTERMQDHPHYRPEVPVDCEFESGDFIFQVGGRMDGFFQSTPARIEEIKSNFNIFELSRRIREMGDDHPYVLQLKTYGYFHWKKTQQIPELVLHLISTRNGETLDLDFKLDLSLYEGWLSRRLKELEMEAELSRKRVGRRQKAAQNFQFPFSRPRAGQVELIQTIEEGMAAASPMLIQAPTGLGKTVGVLYPTLKEALSRGQKVVYLTPKNSQHSVAEDAIEKLQEAGANIKAMTLTAKSKMCFKNEPLCNPDYCEYAKDHYTKIAENKLVEQLAKKRSLKAKTFRKLAQENQVCPFELQLEATADVDAVICDYNYVFAPRAAFGRLSASGFLEKGKPNLVIDEAHNLPSRSMDYFSPALSVGVLQKMKDDISGLPGRFRGEALDHLNECISVVQNCAPRAGSAPCQIQPPVESFLAQDAELRSFLSSYLNSDVHIESGDPVLRLCFYWSEFANALEFVSSGKNEFFTTFHPSPPTVKITCCDASEMLKGSYSEYAQVVAFSATLKPFEYYSQLSGLKSEALKMAEFTSPFPKENRKLLIIPQISSKYSERERNYPRIAEVIEKITNLRKGNYIAFFPSFDFMERVLRQFSCPEGFAVKKQERHMKRDEIDFVLQSLAEPASSQILFAVQGGVFSEGVDYPGKMVIGAFIVGPPLPNFDLEREKMREYYQENFSAGFDYAYTYPAMAKAVQAAGRVIRSESDKGLIVLMDNRFLHESYTKSMPQDWFEESPHEAVSEKIIRDISDFWARTEGADFLQTERTPSHPDGDPAGDQKTKEETC